MSNLNELLASGAAAFKFDVVGDTVKGVIVHAERSPVTNFTTGEVETTASGKEKTQLVLTLRQDDGEETRVFCKYAAEVAIKEALQAAGADLELGGRLAIRFDSEKAHEKRGYNPIKQFKAQYEAPSKAISSDNLLG